MRDAVLNGFNRTDGMRFVALATCAMGLAVLLSAPSARAQSDRFGKNKVQYREFEWHYLSTDNFDIYFYDGGYDLAVFAARVLDSAYAEVASQVNHRLRERVPCILYQSHNDFQQTNVTGSILEEGVGGFTESFKNRMVMPFTGSYEDFRHVLHHELTHAVIFDKIYGGGFGSILSTRSLFNLPLWFAEGYAEYSSRHGWDTFADMVMRDATVHDYLVPLEYVGGYLAYKEGQSAILYLAERYGEEKIPEIINRGRFESTIDNSLKKAIGMGMKEFSEDWEKRLRREYWPEISEREEPREFARQLTDHDKDGSYMNDKPVFSPRGDRLAIFSERSDNTEVRIISAVDGKELSRVLKGGRSDQFESLHSFQSAMSFSPDGSTLALIAKSGGQDALFLVDVDGSGRDDVLTFGFSAMRSPAYAPDGKSVVFLATRYDRSDLYRVDLETEKILRLTDDHYDEQDPEFHPDGARIVFASDRPSGTASTLRLGGEFDPRAAAYGRYNIFEADLSSGSVRPLTNDDFENRMPIYSPDGTRICFVSNRNGIYNLYVIDSSRSEPYPITNALSGCFSPTWSPDGTGIAFTAFFKGGFDVFLMDNIRPKIEEGDALAMTPFMRRQLGLDTNSFVMRGNIRLSDRVPKALLEEDLEFTSYVHRAKSPLEHEPLGAAEADTAGAPADDQPAPEARRDTTSSAPDTVSGTRELAGKPPPAEPSASVADSSGDTTEYAVRKYRRRFSPDLVSGGLGYDTFFGLRGQSFFVISDYMGDHQLFIVSDLINTIDQSNIQVYYAYRPKRIDYGIGLFHSKYYYIDFDDRLFSDRTYGFVANAARPFSKFTRVQLDGVMLFIDRKFFDPNLQSGEYEDRFARVGLGSISLVHDDIIWGLTGPVTGRRYRLELEYAPGGVSEGISYQAALLDFRQYARLGGRYSVAFRLAGGVSGGKTPKRYYVGGVENWIGSSIGRGDVYDVEGLYFADVITPLRGYNYYALSGNRFFVANAEFRFPFVEYLALRFPLPIVLSRIGGAIFGDMGAAWDDNNFRGAITEDGFRLNDIKASFGYGVRANLGFIVLRFDQAWRTNLDSVDDKPKSYFSIGADF